MSQLTSHVRTRKEWGSAFHLLFIHANQSRDQPHIDYSVNDFKSALRMRKKIDKCTFQNAFSSDLFGMTKTRRVTSSSLLSNQTFHVYTVSQKKVLFFLSSFFTLLSVLLLFEKERKKDGKNTSDTDPIFLPSFPPKQTSSASVWPHPWVYNSHSPNAWIPHLNEP